MNEEEIRQSYLGHLDGVAAGIVDTLRAKDAAYGGSWQKRGGQGAFMMLARKMDRIENMCKANQYDLFALLFDNQGDIKDDVEDLIGYLLLCLARDRAIQSGGYID